MPWLLRRLPVGAGLLCLVPLLPSGRPSRSRSCLPPAVPSVPSVLLRSLALVQFVVAGLPLLP
ncbi:hypothetical protein, partial [Paenarthrobacter sp. NPDC090522]|uniref:hypothetical protein n=1 Tax=Paenarthrobacter sp. NPDC090522 TaxID=3364383 RepID=UPI003808EE4F